MQEGGDGWAQALGHVLDSKMPGMFGTPQSRVERYDRLPTRGFMSRFNGPRQALSVLVRAVTHWGDVTPTAAEVVANCLSVTDEPGALDIFHLGARMMRPVKRTLPYKCSVFSQKKLTRVLKEDLATYLAKHGVALGHMAGHAVAVYGVRDGMVYVADSARGYYEVYDRVEPLTYYGLVDQSEQETAIRSEPLSLPTPDAGLIQPWFDLVCAVVAVTAASALTMTGASWQLFKTMILIIAAVTCVVVVWYIASRLSGRFVRVHSRHHTVDVNAAKDYFAELQKIPLHSVPGKHLSLAKQRRECEKAAFHLLRQSGFPRVRDVGGSRSRFPELGYFKHICAGVNGNADLLRNEKAAGNFENCFMPGELCPMRRAIPAAVLSHVDYYLDDDQLLEVVQGPTIVINHSFDGDSGGFGVIARKGQPNKYEATWEKENGRITMKAEDGTPYTHGFRPLESEGEVVAGGKACSYVRLARWADTSIYYFCPINGVYDGGADSVTHYVRPELSMFDVGGVAYSYFFRDGKSPLFVVRRDGDRSAERVELPAGPVEDAVNAMLLSPRDDAFHSCLSNIVTSRLRAMSPNMVVKAQLSTALAEHLCAERTLGTVRSYRFAGLDPIHTSSLGTYCYQVADWLRWFGLRQVLESCVKSPRLATIARIAGAVHRVPVYEVYTSAANMQLSGHRMKYRFPGSAPSDIAGHDGGAELRAAQEPRECEGVGRAEGGEPGDNALAVDGAGVDEDSQGVAGKGAPVEHGQCGADIEEDGGQTRQRGDGATGGAVPRPTAEDDGPPAGAGRTEHCDGDNDGDGATPACDFGRAWAEHLSEPHFLRRAFVVNSSDRDTEIGVVLPVTGDRQVITAKVRGTVCKDELQDLARLLCALPPILHHEMRCALSTAMRSVGIQLRARGCYHKSPACYRVRVLPYSGDGACRAGYYPVTLRGVGYQVPSEAAQRIKDRAREGVEIVGPHTERTEGVLLPQDRDDHENDGPAQHLPKKRRVPVDTRSRNQRNRTSGKGGYHVGKGFKPARTQSEDAEVNAVRGVPRD